MTNENEILRVAKEIVLNWNAIRGENAEQAIENVAAILRSTIEAERFPASTAPVVDELWEALKAEVCKSDKAELIVFLTEEKLRRAWSRLAPAAATAAPQLDTRPSCWHCGVVLAEAPKLRCEDCPEECDAINCDAYGCAERLAIQHLDSWK